MYTVAVRRTFFAQHYLIGGDWGAENELHTHAYTLEVQLHGNELDQHGYLVDITEIEARLDELTARYRDRSLNQLPEFAELNPSLEHFARILAQALFDKIQASNLNGLTVQLWENDQAWASYALESK
jgi:6-pyruvoyltetrahydropterin/6-carboxytetrahydropterin synthase